LPELTLRVVTGEDKTALLRLRGENDLSTNLIIQPSLVE